MTITGSGFDGSVDEVQFARLMTLAGVRYSIATPNDYVATPVNGTRAVSFSAGNAYAAGVLAENNAAVTVPLLTPAAGQWSLLVLRRDWVANTCKLVAIDGATTSTVTPTAAPVGSTIKTVGPGNVDDQPLYWAWVQNASTAVILYDIRDLPVDSRIAATAKTGTAAQRNTYWGIPGSAEERLLLQNRGAQWSRVEVIAGLGLQVFTEQYVAEYHPTNNPFGPVLLPYGGWVSISSLTTPTDNPGYIVRDQYAASNTVINNTGSYLPIYQSVVTLSRPMKVRLDARFQWYSNQNAAGYVELIVNGVKLDSSRAANSGLPGAIITGTVEGTIILPAGDTPYILQANSESGGSPMTFQHKNVRITAV